MNAAAENVCFKDDVESIWKKHRMRHHATGTNYSTMGNTHDKFQFTSVKIKNNIQFGIEVD